MKMNSILTGHAAYLLAKLRFEYLSGVLTTSTLNELRDELGHEEYRRFEADLSTGMRRSNAWTAVGEIIGAAEHRRELAEERYIKGFLKREGA